MTTPKARQICAYLHTLSDHKNSAAPQVVVPPQYDQWAIEELNLGPHAYQACALTT
jgi:hypothetical protein